MKRTANALLLALAWVIAIPAAAGAASIEGVTFTERHPASGLTLRGVGLLRYRVVFKGYVAALYLTPDVPAEDVLEDVPKRLEIEYFWAIEGRDFAKAQDEGIARNVDAAVLERIRPQMTELSGLYQNVEPGDRYALTYTPGHGTELSLNGERLGVVRGAEFARAVFSIWLGEKPLSRSLKTRLLGSAQ